MHTSFYTDLLAEMQARWQRTEDFYTEAAGSDLPGIVVPTDLNVAVLTFLLEEKGFSLLADITGVHYPEQQGKELSVVYHLRHLKANILLRLKVYLPESDPKIFSATQVFAGANWMERETYDFFGIIFVGHPDLRRILNVDEMDYFPLRKQYALEEKTRRDKDDAMFGRKTKQSHIAYE